MTDSQLFPEDGSEGTAVDAQENVYLAAGQIRVDDQGGRFRATLAVPERPLQLVFGGKDGATLFIPARTSLDAVRTRFTGR